MGKLHYSSLSDSDGAHTCRGAAPLPRSGPPPAAERLTTGRVGAARVGGHIVVSVFTKVGPSEAKLATP